MAGKLFGGTPAERCEFVFGQPMEPCPECGSYKLMYQSPIKLDEPPPDKPDAKALLRSWARAHRNGSPMLEGPVYMACQECWHYGPAMDCSGRTSDDVSHDPAVATEVKRLWNEAAKSARGRGVEEGRA